VLATGMWGLHVPVEPDAGTNSNRAVFSLDAAYALAAPGTVRVECNKGAAAQSLQAAASLTALATARVTAVP
jgi:hypothetical protein